MRYPLLQHIAGSCQHPIKKPARQSFAILSLQVLCDMKSYHGFCHKPLTSTPHFQHSEKFRENMYASKENFEKDMCTSKIFSRERQTLPGGGGTTGGEGQPHEETPRVKQFQTPLTSARPPPLAVLLLVPAEIPRISGWLRFGIRGSRMERFERLRFLFRFRFLEKLGDTHIGGITKGGIAALCTSSQNSAQICAFLQPILVGKKRTETHQKA